MRKPEPSRFIVLSPYDPREAVTLKQAAARAGKSVGTIKNWCLDRGIWRRVGGGTWCVSKVALEMVLEDDDAALLAYHQQAWGEPVVNTRTTSRLLSIRRRVSIRIASREP